MRAWYIALLVGPSLVGCAHGRAIPREALIHRAEAGEEPPPTDRARKAVRFAESQIGKRYCWGGTGPRCYDCSGLAFTAWRHAGVKIPRTSDDIADSLPEVPLKDIRPGDILWWPGHVGIYDGDGWVVDALNARRGVVRRPATDPFKAFRPPVEWGSSRPGKAGSHGEPDG